jgi:hypothetical protein
MRWLIRRVIKKGKGSFASEEEAHEGDVLTIGRATDQAIFLSDLHAALNHARVSAIGGGQYRVESLIVAGIRVNSEIIQAVTVRAGAKIEVGSTRLTLLAPPRGYDAAIEITALDKSEQAAVKAGRARPTTLAQTGLGKRGPSWLLFVLVLGFGLGLPMASHFSPLLRAFLAHAHLPGTGLWNPGPLDSAHRYFGADCTQCHQQPFVTVRNDACLTCHAKTKAHADPAKFHLAALGDTSCRTCHQDHDGASGLIRTDQGLCADCHADLKNKTQQANQLSDAADFGTKHPEFRVNLPAWDASGKFSPQATRWSTDIKEMSGLKFNHQKHLVAKGLNTPDGHRVLTCVDCHQAQPGGAKMQPIAFEGVCHQCHTLTFDTLDPDREVPHANPAGVIYTLDEYYAKRALEGGYADARAPVGVQQRRRPGQAAASPQQKEEALAWARDHAREAARTVFTGKACVTCHTVTEPAQPGDDWKIAPVRVSGAWYVDAKFTHAKHATMKCEDCHKNAERSHASGDLLIPGIATCRECHSGAHVDKKVQSTCIDCHDYHRAPELMKTFLEPLGKEVISAAR